ncbi:MAG: tripartite tricarboxylate transporter TctB family protein [Eubacteriales bacterium]|jgi:hypothetical protein
MKKIRSQQVIPFCGFLFAMVFLYIGLTELGFWGKQGPMPGFFPSIMAGVMAAISLLALFTFGRNKPAAYCKENFWPIYAVAAIIASTYLIGLVASVLLFIVIWLLWVEKAPWKGTLCVTAIMAAIVFGVFVFWLKVRFPLGVLGEWLMDLL